MKLLFLDVDGVLNSRAAGIHGLKQVHVDELVRIIKATGCKIVLSSGWRLPTLAQTRKSVFGRDLRELDSGLLVLNSVIDVTPEGDSRAKEIRAWLAYTDHNVQQYIVLDDEEVQDPHLFQTNYNTGLTTEIADAIIEHLNT